MSPMDGRVLALALLAPLVLLVFPSSETGETTLRIPVSLTVGDHIGFNASNESLAFGMVTPGGSSTRFVHLENKNSEPCRVTTHVRGELNAWTEVEKSSVLGQTAELRVKVEAPEDAKPGEYAGSLEIAFDC